jgi:predicted ATPase
MLAHAAFSLGLWLSGWPEQSQRQYHNLLTRAAQLGNTTSSVTARVIAAVLALLRGDLEEARQLADQTVGRAKEHGSVMYSALGMVVQGCTLVWGKGLATGTDTLKKALSDYRATGAQSLLPVFLSLLAEALSRCGKSEGAFATLAEALKLSETSLDVYWEAELYRLKGELTLAQSSVQRLESSVKAKQKAKISQSQLPNPKSQAEAEACFLKAIEIARRQEAKTLELRAVMSLARLWQHQGKKAEAHRMLSDLYNWFTEGFDTKDLQDAHTLLAQIA